MKRRSVHIIYSGLGGHFDYVFNLVNAMQAASETHILFFGVEEVPAYYYKKCGEKNIACSTILKTGFGFSAAWKMIRILKQIRPQLIYVHSNAAVIPVRWYQKRYGAKTVAIEHHNHQLKTNKDQKRSRYTQRQFDRVIFLTASHRNQAKQLMHDAFNESKSVVINTGIPQAYFRAPHPADASVMMIGMQSRLVPIKDHETLIRAFNNVCVQFPQAMLRLAGDGTERDRLTALTKELGIEANVHFEGMLAKPELMSWLDQLTIYVHATLGETSSIALMEALSHSLPTIVSDVPGINDFVTSDVAVLVPAKDVKALEDALLNLLKDDTKRGILSENAFKFAVENCSLQTMADAYLKLEKEMLA